MRAPAPGASALTLSARLNCRGFDADNAEPTRAETVNQLDPDVVRLLEQLARAGRPPLNTLTPEEARANSRALVELRGDTPR